MITITREEKYIVKVDDYEVGYIRIEGTKQHYVFVVEKYAVLTWSDIYEIQCKLSELNENYIPF